MEEGVSTSHIHLYVDIRFFQYNSTDQNKTFKCHFQEFWFWLPATFEKDKILFWKRGFLYKSSSRIGIWRSSRVWMSFLYHVRHLITSRHLFVPVPTIFLHSYLPCDQFMSVPTISNICNLFILVPTIFIYN